MEQLTPAVVMPAHEDEDGASGDDETEGDGADASSQTHDNDDDNDEGPHMETADHPDAAEWISPEEAARVVAQQECGVIERLIGSTSMPAIDEDPESAREHAEASMVPQPEAPEYFLPQKQSLDALSLDEAYLHMYPYLSALCIRVRARIRMSSALCSIQPNRRT